MSHHDRALRLAAELRVQAEHPELFDEAERPGTTMGRRLATLDDVVGDLRHDDGASWLAHLEWRRPRSLVHRTVLGLERHGLAHLQLDPDGDVIVRLA